MQYPKYMVCSQHALEAADTLLSLWKTASFIHILFQDVFSQQVLPYLSIKEGKPVSLLLVSSFWLVQNQLTGLFRCRLNIWNRHWILLFLSICFFPQTKKISKCSVLSRSSHFWLYVHIAIYFRHGKHKTFYVKEQSYTCLKSRICGIFIRLDRIPLNYLCVPWPSAFGHICVTSYMVSN